MVLPTVAGVIDWMFRNRRTGGLTIAQLPNASFGIFLAASAVRLLASPGGGYRTALDVIAGVALLWWAGDEVIRGVNPFRRMLGFGVLIIAVVGFFR
jgi:hypothetical protein